MDYIIKNLRCEKYTCNGEDLHNEMFVQSNSVLLKNDRDAEKWLGDLSWDAITEVREYEEINFGEFITETTPYAIGNALVSQIGESLLAHSDILNSEEVFDQPLRDDWVDHLCDAIADELEEKLDYL
jgi:hypothetical protein